MELLYLVPHYRRDCCSSSWPEQQGCIFRGTCAHYMCIYRQNQKVQHSCKYKQLQWPHPFHSLADYEESLFLANAYVHSMDPPARGLKFLLCSVTGPWIPMSPSWQTNMHGSLVAGPGIPPVAKSQTFWSLQHLAQTHGSLAPKPSAWLVWLGFALGHTLAQLSRLCAWAPASVFWCLRVPATRDGKAPAAGICVSVHGHTQWRFSVTKENSYKCSLTSS